MDKFFAVFVIILSFVASAVVMGMAHAEKSHTFRTSMFLGQGIDGIDGELKGACVEALAGTETIGGQGALFSIRQITSAKEFRKELSLEVEAAYVGVGSARVDFKEKHEFNSFSKYVVAVSKVKNSDTHLKMHDVRLRPNALALLEAGNIERFTERCGTEFISAFVTGGEFFALYEFSSTSESNLEEISAEAQASYGLFSASAEFKSKLETLSKSGHFSLDVFRDGDTAAPIPLEPDKIIEYAANFSIAIANPNKAVVYSAISFPYSVLDLPDIPLVAFNLKRFNDELSLINLKFDTYADAIADLGFVIEHPSQFVDFTPDIRTKVFNSIDNFRSAQRALEKRAKACLEQKEPCFVPDNESENVQQMLVDIIPSRRVQDSQTTQMIAQCQNMNTDGARIVSLENIDNQIVLVVRADSEEFRPRHLRVTKIPRGASRWDGMRPPNLAGGNRVNTGSSRRTSNSNARFLVTATLYEYWQPVGRLDEKQIARGCTVYRDNTPRHGKICYSVQQSSALANVHANEGDTACVNIR